MKMRTAQILALGLIALVLMHRAGNFVFAQTATFTPTPGPDVIVSKIQSTTNYSCNPNPCLDPIDGTAIDAIAVGTVSCNIGTEPLQWEDFTPEHPVIRSGAFRFLNGRFEQIGTSWVKHGFFATNETTDCFGICSTPNIGGYQLNPGCSDLYASFLNGSWSYIGPASAVNAFTGTNPDTSGYAGTRPVDARLQIHYSDLNPSLNLGALYFLQAHYVTADDAAAGNAENNASYRRALVTYNANQNTYDVNITSSTRQQEPAINAWQEFDPAVVQVNARVPAEGLFIVSARATEVGATFWHYEYAIENLNSDRSGASFTIPLPQHAIVQNIGFHDVDYHSGEPYSRDNWAATIENNQIAWSCVSYDQNPNANALRWSTLYNFRFDVNSPPDPKMTTATLGLFKPGAPNSITVQTVGPTLEISDCNHNGTEDLCDIDCNNFPFCEQPCGFSNDCNHNSVPDECEADCNHNGIADECDIRDCPPGNLACADCNNNSVPDGCEPDCNGNGIPDTCELILDADGDGVDDCYDLCPLTTPEGACDPPSTVTCRFVSGLCSPGFPFKQCTSGGGTAVCGDPSLPCNLLSPCITSACRDGCLLGDRDGDGDVDLLDSVGLQECYSGNKDAPDFVAASSDCLIHFDFDGDGDVDSIDAREVYARISGPRQ
ncbi:MAG: hypothetical protein HY287_11845 [Planctomycetes bacterium]|nr:hypothetical protein [Planctomycetota bacterium]